ncbi:glycosyltransferase family 2 protein, partial [Pseudomonas syringae pv. tagetis]
LQVVAVGQHDLSVIPLFLAQSRQYPDALICGYPRFDESVPKGSLYARYLTHVWVWINTLSLHIRDSMFGFRLYPLAPV